MSKRKTPLVPQAKKALASLQAEIEAEQERLVPLPGSAVERFRELARAYVHRTTSD